MRFSCAAFAAHFFMLWGDLVGFRFRKSINLGSGFKINLSKSGVGYSWGTKGVRFTKSTKGTNRTTFSIPDSGISYTTETSSNKAKHKSTSQASSCSNTNDNYGGTSMVWIDFIICLLFGIFGVHKFKNRQVGMGILYLLTGGLLGIGWLYDCAKYLILALKVQTQMEASSFSKESIANEELPRDFSKILGCLKKYGAWILTALFALLALVYMPSFASFIALLAIVLVIPIPKWQSILNRYIYGIIKKIAVVVLALFTLIAAPSGSSGVGNNDLPSTVPSTTTTAHIHSFQDATCVAPKTCSTCGAEEGDPLAHQWTEATCQVRKTCVLCHIEDGVLADHTWVDATCLDPKTCSVCKTTEGTLGNHNWIDATCIEPQTCSVCKETEGTTIDHTWTDATCTAPRTCSVCKVTDGDPVEHTWNEATCLAPETCSVCHITEGELGDHSWQDATCLAPMTCSACGETDGYRAKHSYSDGICIICDKKEPTVWIPQSGEKYHSRSSCSNMKNPTEVPISQAEAWDYEPCGRCY